MSATFVRETHAAYRRLRRFIPLGVLRSEKEYRKAVAILDEIIDEIGQDEAHPLANWPKRWPCSSNPMKRPMPKSRGNGAGSLKITHGSAQPYAVRSAGDRKPEYRVRNSLRRTRTQHSTDPAPGEAIRGLPCRLHHRPIRQEETVPMSHELSCQ
jgi:hypothetical protein